MYKERPNSVSNRCNLMSFIFTYNVSKKIIFKKINFVKKGRKNRHETLSNNKYISRKDDLMVSAHKDITFMTNIIKKRR